MTTAEKMDTAHKSNGKASFEYDTIHKPPVWLEEQQLTPAETPA